MRTRRIRRISRPRTSSNRTAVRRVCLGILGNIEETRGPPTVNTEKTAWVHQIDEIETPPPPPPVPSPEKSTLLTIQENEKQEDEAPPSPPTPIYHHPVRPRKHDISRFEMRKRAEKLRNQNQRLLTAFTDLISSSSKATTTTTPPKQRTSALISRSNLESRRSEVALWLKRLRMDRYINTFLLSGFVSLPLVATVTKTNLKDMGVAKAHIEKVLGPAIKNLASSQAIMHERARNACDMEYNTRGDDRLVAVRESKTSAT